MGVVKDYSPKIGVSYKAMPAGSPSAPSANSTTFQPGHLTGIGLVRMARAKYDFAVDGGAIGLITPALNATLPDNAIIVGGILNPTTALIGATATIAVGTAAGSSASAIKAATAVATYSLDAILATVPVFTAASAFKMTAAGAITLTVATAALTAGVLEITLFYIPAAN